MTAERGDQGAECSGELHHLREQVQQARAVLAQLHEAAIAVEGRSSGRNATHLAAANEQLVVAAMRSETRFRAYFDVSPEFLYLLRLTANDQFIVEDVNPAGAGLYGLPREQIIGRTDGIALGQGRDLRAHSDFWISFANDRQHNRRAR
jgi:PAS domain-containing protein